MLLPGGLVDADGAVDRRYAFKPVDGAVECALAEAAAQAPGPEVVSCALAAALDALGDAPASRQRVDSLSVPDRRYLMIRLAEMLGMSSSWSSHGCAQCGAPFDFVLDLAQLPVVPAGRAYSRISVQTGAGPLRLRVPTGADQLRIAAIRDDDEALCTVAAFCIAPQGDGPAPKLSPADIEAIDAAVEDAAPKIPWAIDAACPECGTGNVIPIDVSAWLGRLAGGPTVDVHEIATAYGWSERDILSLTRAKRQRYLALIRGRRDVLHADAS